MPNVSGANHANFVANRFTTRIAYSIIIITTNMKNAFTTGNVEAERALMIMQTDLRRPKGAKCARHDS